MRLYIVHLISFWMELYSHIHTLPHYIHVLWSKLFIECNLDWPQDCKASRMIKTITTSSRWKTCTASGERMVFHTKLFPMMHSACAYACVGLCKDVDQEELLLPYNRTRFLSERVLCPSLSLFLSLSFTWKSRAAKMSGIGYYGQYIASRKRF